MAATALAPDWLTISERGTTTIWSPHPGSQVAFLSCPFWEVLYEGERGPGKTDSMLMKFAMHVGQGWGEEWRGIIFRREYKQLDDLVKKSKKIFRRLFPGARWLSSKSDYRWVWPTGEELSFRVGKTADDYWDYHGHEYPFIGLEELTNWADDGLYEAMKSCSRSSRIGIPRFYVSNCNPYGVGHSWVKARFVDMGPPGTVVTDANGLSRVRIHGYLAENLTLLAADPTYKDRLNAITNDALRQAWAQGRWDIQVGGFLQGYWDPEIHVVPPLIVQPHWPRWRAGDWGFAAPYSVGWYCKDDKGVTYRYRELYGWGGKANVGTRESVNDVATKIKAAEAGERKASIEFRRNPLDSAAWSGNGTEITPGELFTKAGVRWVPAQKGPGSRKTGAQIVLSMLQAGTFKVTANCLHFLRTVPVLMPDPDDWDDVDTTMEDHVWDELRYSLVSRHRQAPQEEKDDGPPVGSYDWLVKETEPPKRKSIYRL